LMIYWQNNYCKYSNTSLVSGTNAYSGDSLLFEILHYHFFQIPAIEIAKAAILSNDKSNENRKVKYSFRRYLQENVSITTSNTIY
jgi:hypothetical protein